MSQPSEPKIPDEKETYYKQRSRAWIVALILTPILSLVGSGITSYFTAKSAIYQSDIELAKLAIEVLKSPEGGEEMDAWALEVLSKHTQVPIAPDRQKEILKVIKASSGISVKDIQDHGVLGGENSEVRKISEKLGKEFKW